MQQKDGANGWDPATRSKWNGAKSNVVSSPKSTTEQGKSTDFLSEMQQKLEREGERSERMEAAGNVMTKEFDGAKSNVVSSSETTTEQSDNGDGGESDGDTTDGETGGETGGNSEEEASRMIDPLIETHRALAASAKKIEEDMSDTHRALAANTEKVEEEMSETHLALAANTKKMEDEMSETHRALAANAEKMEKEMSDTYRALSANAEKVGEEKPMSLARQESGGEGSMLRGQEEEKQMKSNVASMSEESTNALSETQQELEKEGENSERMEAAGMDAAGTEAAGKMTTKEFDGAKSNVVSSPQSTTEQGKSTDLLSEMQQKLEREGERSERMEAAGNVMTKDFDDAQSNVVSSSKSTTKQGKNTDSLSEMQQELKREGERSERMEA